MGRKRRLLGTLAVGAVVVPPVAAWVVKQRVPEVGDATSDEVTLVAVYEGRQSTSHARALRRMRLECWYGGLDVDLRAATLDPAGGDIVVRSVFGGVRIVVPDTWRVDVRSRPLFGGIDDDTEGEPGGPVLTVDATAVFGGIQVTSRPVGSSWAGRAWPTSVEGLPSPPEPLTTPTEPAAAATAPEPGTPADAATKPRTRARRGAKKPADLAEAEREAADLAAAETTEPAEPA